MNLDDESCAAGLRGRESARQRLWRALKSGGVFEASRAAEFEAVIFS